VDGDELVACLCKADSTLFGSAVALASYGMRSDPTGRTYTLTILNLLGVLAVHRECQENSPTLASQSAAIVSNHIAIPTNET
jgi:hypothetical protein